MSIEREPQPPTLPDYHEMERIIHDNNLLESDAFALLRWQNRLFNLLPAGVEDQLVEWAESSDGSSVIDQLELSQFCTILV